MNNDLPELLIKRIKTRELPEGGFPSKPEGLYRPDATAWAALALDAAGDGKTAVNKARSRLAADQMEDGRVCLSRNHPQTFWPTAPAVLAWHHSPAHQESQRKGIEFLLATAGEHWEKKKNSPAGHNTALRGWPWIEETHSWVEPTSLVLMALALDGKGDHQRAVEAECMLLDRQLPSGGWNYGNTTVFGRQLRPMPESTGLALSALVNMTARRSVEKSISYLKKETGRLTTPLSFGWSCLGLSSWGERPQIEQDALIRSLKRREIFGAYGTEELSLLLIALQATNGLLSLLGEVPAK
jgi:hypothetical protein